MNSQNPRAVLIIGIVTLLILSTFPRISYLVLPFVGCLGFALLLSRVAAYRRQRGPTIRLEVDGYERTMQSIRSANARWSGELFVSIPVSARIAMRVWKHAHISECPIVNPKEMRNSRPVLARMTCGTDVFEFTAWVQTLTPTPTTGMTEKRYIGSTFDHETGEGIEHGAYFLLIVTDGEKKPMKVRAKKPWRLFLSPAPAAA